MKDADKHMDAILKRIKKSGCVLMLDFDGTLSPIVARHRSARISVRTRKLLRNVARRFPVAVISGRALSDVRKRVGLPVSYVGSHGLETHILGTQSKMDMRVPRASMSAFQRATRALERVARKYTGVKIENKKLCYAVHYRALSLARARQFVEEASATVDIYVHLGGIRVLNDLCTFDIMPDLKSTKGHSAYKLNRALRGNSSAIPIYIGDSSTDEDAFRTFTDGITIRIVRNTASAAQYYFRSRTGVDRFLCNIANVKI